MLTVGAFATFFPCPHAPPLQCSEQRFLLCVKCHVQEITFCLLLRVRQWGQEHHIRFMLRSWWPLGTGRLGWLTMQKASLYCKMYISILDLSPHRKEYKIQGICRPSVRVILYILRMNCASSATQFSTWVVLWKLLFVQAIQWYSESMPQNDTVVKWVTHLQFRVIMNSQAEELLSELLSEISC